MINDFEEETEPLDANELKCMHLIAKGLARHKGKEAVISNKEMCAKMNQAISDGLYKDIPREFKLSQSRIRKIINHLRINDILPLLCATSNGYYVANNREEAESYIQSLKDRISSIQNMATHYIKQYNERFNVNQQKLDINDTPSPGESSS
jgi:hypothetical protein